MEKSILIVQFRTDVSFLMERMCFYTKLLRYPNVRLNIINALDKSIPWDDPEEFLNGHSGVILGGSSELYFSRSGDKEHDAVRDDMLRHAKKFSKFLIARDVPTLGICFGHQLIGNVLGSSVVNDPCQAKTGSYEVVLTPEGSADRIFSGFPKKFLAQYGHKDSLAGLPKGSVLLARGNRCRVSAFRYKSNIYSVQFHPELSMRDIISRVQAAADYVPDGKKAEDLFCETMTPKILENFVSKIAL